MMNGTYILVVDILTLILFMTRNWNNGIKKISCKIFYVLSQENKSKRYMFKIYLKAISK